MKILFISNHLLFPPKDGITIPPANYLQGLAKKHEVDYLFLEQCDKNFSPKSFACTRSEVRKFWKVHIKRQALIKGISSEFLMSGPYYGAWYLLENLPEEISKIDYDVIWGCTPMAIAFFSRREIRERISGNVYIAGISDLHSLVIKKQALNANKSHSLKTRIFKRVVLYLRSFILVINECRMLKDYNLILVQTEKERAWILQKGGRELFEKTLCLANAVNESLFYIPMERHDKSLVFVGILSGMYGDRLGWFIKNIWSKILKKHPDVKLTVIGRGASESLGQLMEKAGIKHIPFVDDLKDVYRYYTILVAPIFKGYGIINKVIEAMAGGSLVIGDSTAFNGIDGFISGKHGLVANTEKDFIQLLNEALQSPDFLQDKRKAARILISQNFRWSERIDQVEEKINALLQ